MDRSTQRWTSSSLQMLAGGTSLLTWSFGFLSFERLIAFLSYGSETAFFGLVGAILGWLGTMRIRSALRMVQGVESQPAVASEPEPVSGPSPEPVAMPTPAPAQPAAAWTPPIVTTPVPPEPDTPPVPRDPINWELWIGRRLLPALGIGIVLIGMLVFLKYSFENRWIDELGRIVLSVMAAIGFMVFGEWHHRKYHQWSGWFTGAGLVLMYFTVWVTHVLYAVPLMTHHQLSMPAGLATGLYMAITALGALAATRYRNQIIAWCTLTGGYLTPFLVDVPERSLSMLVIYLLILAMGLLALAWANRWRYLNLACFIVTQLYLAALVYPDSTWSDRAQAWTAVLFFVVFGSLPLLYQFRLQQKAENDDVLLILFSTVAVAVPVVDAVGGIKSDLVGFVCLALAAVHLAFAAGALRFRREDSSFIDTYVIGSSVLIALGILAQLKIGWVAVGWGVFSVALLEAACRVQRASLMVMARIVLVFALGSLLFHLPLLPEREALWHPFTSTWSLQSYVIFGCVAYWIHRLRTAPQALIGLTRGDSQGVLHGVLALLTFAFFTFEATQLDWHADTPWTYAYILLAAVSLAAYVFTRASAWLILALIAQGLGLYFVFAIGETSGLSVYGTDPGVVIIPFAHAWSLPSLLLLGLLVATPRVLEKTPAADGLPVLRPLLTGVALAQVWIHVTVELRNYADILHLTGLGEFRLLHAWWVVFALAVLGYGIVRDKARWLQGGLWLLVIPFAAYWMRVVDHGGMLPDTLLWTVLPMLLMAGGAWGKRPLMETFGVCMLAVVAGTDMLLHWGDRSLGLVTTVWWSVVAAIVMVMGFSADRSSWRRLAIALFGTTALKMLLIDFAVLSVPVRIGASIVTGLLMIAASYLYQRFGSALSSTRS